MNAICYTEIKESAFDIDILYFPCFLFHFHVIFKGNNSGKTRIKLRLKKIFFISSLSFMIRCLRVITWAGSFIETLTKVCIRIQILSKLLSFLKLHKHITLKYSTMKSPFVITENFANLMKDLLKTVERNFILHKER